MNHCREKTIERSPLLISSEDGKMRPYVLIPTEMAKNDGGLLESAGLKEDLAPS